MPCVQLDADYRCQLFGKPERPGFCVSLRPNADMCGDNRWQALALLDQLEVATAPAALVGPVNSGIAR